MLIFWTYPISFGSNSFDLFSFLADNVLWTVIGAALLFGLFGYLTFRANQSPKTTDLSESLIQSLIAQFGGLTNILKANIVGNRVSVTVKNPRLAQLEALKEAGALGIFVSGNQIKLMFPFDASMLVERITQLITEAKS